MSSAGRDPMVHKPEESMESSSSSSSGQHEAESHMKHHSKILSKCLSKTFMKKAKDTDEPQRVEIGPSESKESESGLTVQDQVWKAETLWALRTASESSH